MIAMLPLFQVGRISSGRFEDFEPRVRFNKSPNTEGVDNCALSENIVDTHPSEHQTYVLARALAKSVEVLMALMEPFLCSCRAAWGNDQVTSLLTWGRGCVAYCQTRCSTLHMRDEAA